MDKSYATAYIALITIVFGTILYLFPEQKESPPRLPEADGKDFPRRGQAEKVEYTKPTKANTQVLRCAGPYAANSQSC